MLTQYPTEEEKESKSVDNATGPDMPPGFTDEECEYATSHPNHIEYVRGYVAIEIEQTPGEKKQRKGIGQQVPETAMYQRMGKDAEHAALFHGIHP